MVDITVGVPVYNGIEFLDESLRCLRDQTMRQFQVIIADNASTDGSAELAEKYAREDSRFTVLHHPRNVGARGNFDSLLNKADTKYFLWRAHDDLSAENYIEELYRSITITSRAKLAVGKYGARRITPGQAIPRARIRPPTEHLDRDAVERVLSLMVVYAPQWFYGMWEREFLHDIYFPVCKAFPHLAVSDIVIVLAAILRDRVAVSNETYFIQQRILSERREAGSSEREIKNEEFPTFHSIIIDLLTEQVNKEVMEEDHVAQLHRLARISARYLSRRSGGRQRALQQKLTNILKRHKKRLTINEIKALRCS